jgi:hypothetical protein
MNHPHTGLSLAEDRAGTLLAARLDEGLQDVGPDVSERLRFARERAVARARQARLQAAAPQRGFAVSGGLALAGAGAGDGSATATGWSAWLPGSATGLGHDTSSGPWWRKLVSALPLLILALGFVAIQDTLMEHQIQAAAEVDAALLSDDLPPQAYADPGFAEFLRRQER